MSAMAMYTPEEAAARSWYAVRVRGGRELAIADALRAAGIPEFLPETSIATRWTDRTKIARVPLFAGYLFAHFARRLEQSAVLNIAPGVFQILGNNEFDSVPDAEITSLRTACESNVALKPGPHVAGASVVVVRGPFAGVIGVINRVKNETILSIPVQILGRSVNVQIDAMDVTACTTTGKGKKL